MLTGLPPFAGFTGKWYLFVAVLQNYSLPGGGWYAALAVIGALNSAVSLYYYMRVARAMFLNAPVGEITVKPHMGYQLMPKRPTSYIRASMSDPMARFLLRVSVQPRRETGEGICQRA